jgi:hypothetical protein
MQWLLVAVVITAALAFGVRIVLARAVTRFEEQFERGTTFAAVTPYCAKLDHPEEGEWEEEDAVLELAEHLQAEGLALVGDFVTRPEGKCLRVFSDAARCVYAIIQQQFGQPLCLELLTPYADGRFVSFTDAAPGGLPDPPTHAVTYCPGATPAALLARFLQERPTEGMQATSSGEFAATYLRARRQAMAWMVERGGPTEDEIRRLIPSFPLHIALDMMVDMTRNQWQMAMSRYLQDEAHAQFIAAPSQPAAEWGPRGERLIVVHDRMGAPQLLDVISDAKDPTAFADEDAGDDMDDDFSYDEEDLEADEATLKRIQRLLGDCTPRQAFDQLNAALEPRQRLNKVGAIDRPVAADIYVRP